MSSFGLTNSLATTKRSETIAFLATLLTTQGSSQYDDEPVSQLEHSLQCADLARADGAGSPLIAAALLHDIGHLLPDSEGVAPGHEWRALGLLMPFFGPRVTEPIRLHVVAKRYLCTVEPGYFETLSPASRLSLTQQGGQLSTNAAQQFIQHPFAQDALHLRRWDDQAKVCGKRTPALEYFLSHLPIA